MAPGVRAPDGTVGAELRLEPAHAFAAVAHRRRPATAGAGLLERSPRFIPGRAATQGSPAEAAVVARHPGMGPDPHRRLRGSRPRRVLRPRLAGRRRPWPYSSAARAAHASTVHGCHGDDHAGPETTP